MRLWAFRGCGLVSLSELFPFASIHLKSVAMSTFGDSIVLTSTGPNQWAGEADPNYAHPGGRFGGWTAAALVEAARREPGERGAPLSLSMLYLDPIKDGAVQISTRLLRAGKRIQFWRAELRQGETLCAHAQITFGVRAPSDSFTDVEMPKVPPPEDKSLLEGEAPVPFLQQFRIRWITASPLNLQDQGEKASTQTWVKDVRERPIDNVLLAAMADLTPPRVLFHRKSWVMSSTVSMSVHFHATPEELERVGSDFVLSDVECRRCEGGYFDHELKLWSRDGALLATSEQVAVYKG